jgi:CheY-like chemotaxis protein
MTTPIVALPLSVPYNGAAKKKRVLLLDTSQTKRDLRAEVMRKLGIDVDCAADVLEARSWWRADLYNLVLMCPAKPKAGTGSVPTCEVRLLRKELHSLWAVLSILLLLRILINSPRRRILTL